MSDVLNRKFSEMSASRDVTEECETEGTGYVTSDGYVHEVISKSPARVAIDGGMKQTVTKRVSVTKGEIVAQTAPRIMYGTVAVPLPPTAGQDPLPGSSASSSIFVPVNGSGPPSRSMSAGAESFTSYASSSRHAYRGVASVPTAATTTVPFLSSGGPLPVAGMSSRPLSPTFVRQNLSAPAEAVYSPAPSQPRSVQPGFVEPPRQQQQQQQQQWYPPHQQPQQMPRPTARGVDPSEWARTSRRAEPSYDGGSAGSSRRDSSASRSASAKSVSYGPVDLREVEPSRLSPLHVHEVYAPIRYISKKELRAMRAAAAGSASHAPSTFTERIRHSSVPRLDALAEQRLHSGRVFSPGGGVGDAADTGDLRGPPSADRRTPSQQRGLDAADRDEAAFRSQQRVYPVASSPGRYYAQHGGGGGAGVGMPSEYPPASWGSGSQYADDDLRSVSSAGHYHTESASPGGRGNGGPFVQQHRQYTQPRQITTISDLQGASSGVDLTFFTQHLTFSRGIDKLPSPPQFCREAFLLLHRGTYLIKYGRTGNPHERFLALRFVRDDRTKRQHPYLVWAVHQEAVSFKERIPMVHLMSAQGGVAGCAGIQRHMVDPAHVSGPIVSGKRSVLPTQYAFSWTFQSASQTRTVECLALDLETYRCWVMVGQFLASVNSGADLVEEAETLAPDTPRSTSASAAP